MHEPTMQPSDRLSTPQAQNIKVQKEVTRNKIETWNMPLLRMLKQPKKQMRSGRGRSPKQTELWTNMWSEHSLHSWADTTSRV